MNNRPKRICNRATASLEQLEKVIGDLQKKIQTQGEELGRKDARIKELKDELWELKHSAETVRCKDCKWFHHDINGNGFCEVIDELFTEDNGYCYRGERREK